MSTGLEDTPWFWEEALNSPSTIAVLSVYGAIFLIGLSAAIHARWIEKDEEEQEKIFSAIRTATALTFFVYDFTFMCSRFHWFINSDDAVFTPYDLGDAGMKWVTEKYHDASIETREKYCGYSMDLVLNETTDGGICDFLDWEFAAELVPKGTGFDAGGTKFSMGLGLLLYLVFFWTGFSWKERVVLDPEGFHDEMNEKLEKNEDFDKDDPAQRYALQATVMLFAFLLACQQSLVLLPISGMVSANHYCALVDAPTSQKRAMCLHRFAVLAVPYGLACMLATALFDGVRQGCMQSSMEAPDDDDHRAGKCVTGLLACAAFLAEIYFAFMTVAFFVFWLFGGMAVGLWFTFGSVPNLRDLGAIRAFASPAASLTGEMMRGLSILFFMLKNKPVSSVKKCPGVEDCVPFWSACLRMPRTCCRWAYKKSSFGKSSSESRPPSRHGRSEDVEDACSSGGDVEVTGDAVYMPSAPAPSMQNLALASLPLRQLGNSPPEQEHMQAVPERTTLQPNLKSIMQPKAEPPQAWHNQPTAASFASQVQATPPSFVPGQTQPGWQNQPSSASLGGWPAGGGMQGQPGQAMPGAPPGQLPGPAPMFQPGFYPGQPGMMPSMPGGMPGTMPGGMPFYQY